MAPGSRRGDGRRLDARRGRGRCHGRRRRRRLRGGGGRRRCRGTDHRHRDGLRGAVQPAGQDGLLEPAELLPRLDAEFVDQLAPAPPVDLQRLGLAARPGQRHHELGAQALAERVLHHQVDQPGHELLVQPEGEARVHPLLDDGEPLFVEPGGRGLEHGAGDAAAEARGAAPEPEGALEGGGRLLEAAGLGGGPPGGRGPLEDLEVQLLVLDLDEVARRPGLDDVGQAGLRHAGADDGDADLDLGARGGRRGGTPDRVDEPAHRDDPVGLQEQDRQDDALTLGGDQRRATGTDDFQRPE
ncbi:hypothetical protein GCM10019017_01810 [Streptomyces showdoensis]